MEALAACGLAEGDEAAVLEKAKADIMETAKDKKVVVAPKVDKAREWIRTNP